MDTRIKLDETSQDKLFSLLRHHELTPETLAAKLHVSARTVRDWRRGKYTIPQSHFNMLVSLIDMMPEDFTYSEAEVWWYTRKGGKLGGRSYVEHYGAPGTVLSRQNGGKRSYELRKSNKKDIFTRKSVILAEPSSELAEFIGIMMGDGNVTKYQLSVALDAETDALYADYVVGLIYRLFAVRPTIQYRKKARCIVIVLSSVRVSEHLVALGLPFGHKLRGGLDVPAWTRDSEEYSKECLRGLFDTDGSVFLERHHYGQKVYAYPRLTFVSLSPKLLESVAEMLIQLDIAAKIRGGRSVVVECFTDIEKYFTIVGSSNPKHLKRWAAYGRVG